VLVDGEVAATWRPQKQGDQLAVRVGPLLAPLAAHIHRAIEDEAQRMAPFRQVRSVRVVVE